MTMMNDFNVYKITINNKKEITNNIKYSLEKYPEIIFAYIFGSFVEPEMPFFRDIDIGVYIKDYKESDWHRYEIELPRQLEKQLKYKYPLDLTVINTADILLVKNIIQGELLFVRDENLWADFVTYHAKFYATEGDRLFYYMKEAIIE